MFSRALAPNSSTKQAPRETNFLHGGSFHSISGGEDEAQIGEVKGAEFDKQLDALVVFGERGAKLFTFDFYPYITDILFRDGAAEEETENKAETQPKIFSAMKGDFFMLGRKGDTEYALCDMRTGKFMWQNIGEPITVLEFVSCYANSPKIRANDTVREYYLDP